MMVQLILHLQFKIFRMKSIFVIIVTTFFGHYINAQVVPFAFIKSPANNITSVVIGNQVWTDKNLEVTTYRNGDPIPEVTDPSAWAGLTTGAWCYYNNDPANGAIYGKLYNWYAVNDPRGLAPSGWHVPSDAEWNTLDTYLGGNSVAGGKMKTTTLWASPNIDATNSSGFSGLPGGTSYHGTFYDVGFFGVWWSATERNSSDAWAPYTYYNHGGLNGDYHNKERGFSVRLVKD